MESTLAAVTTTTVTGASLPLVTISRALNCHLSGPERPHLLLTRSSLPNQLAARRPRCIYTSRLSRPNSSCYPSSAAYSSSCSFSSLRSLCATVVAPELSRRLQCVSSSAASYGSVAGGGGDGSDDGDSKSKLGAGVGDGVSAVPSDVIILDVGGMTCGGCEASVKRILESQAQVSSASVNLTTERAIVWPVSEAKALPNWQKELGEALAKHLTSCGFQSSPRDTSGIGEGPEAIGDI